MFRRQSAGAAALSYAAHRWNQLPDNDDNDSVMVPTASHFISCLILILIAFSPHRVLKCCSNPLIYHMHITLFCNSCDVSKLQISVTKTVTTLKKKDILSFHKDRMYE